VFTRMFFGATFLSRRPRQRMQGGLRRAIVHSASVLVENGRPCRPRASDVDDAASARLDHLGKHGPRDPHWCADIHFENLIPRLVVDVEGIGKRHKPRIVHQNVNAATQSQRRLDDPLWGVVVCHIGRYRDGPPADRPHLSGRLLEAFRIPAHQNEIRPPGGQVLRQC
jgi:hypothetical protein